MTLQKYIQEQILTPRLNDKGVLVVYDPDRRYRELTNGLQSESLKVVDATESSIESREEAMKTFIHMSDKDNDIQGLVIYVPTAISIEPEEKQRDPFSIYGICCNTFPDAMSDADSYENICLKFKADYQDDIRKLFASDANPSMEAINAIGGGTSWPLLKSILGVESAMEVLKTLMAPTDAQREALNQQPSWMSEAKELCQSVLQFTPKTRAKKLEPLNEELWRYVLFSEFVFDLPVDLPNALQEIPKVPKDKQGIVESLCDQLRSDVRIQDVYIDHADRIEQELKLAQHCQTIDDLGNRDTFAFEERSFIRLVIKKLEADDTDSVQKILQHHARSVWTRQETVKAQWDVVAKSLQLIEKSAQYGASCDERTKNLQSLIEWYTESLRELDKLHREFEQSASASWEDHDKLEGLLTLARRRYKKVIENVHQRFITFVDKEGWPPSVGISNTQAFETMVAPKLKESGRKIAYIMVDALRYELGLELVKELNDHGTVEVKTAFSVLPSITQTGMASLLPEASSKLSVIKKDDGFVTAYDSKPMTTVAQRMKVLEDRYGSRVAQMTLSDFIKPKQQVADATELFVLRSVEIDHFFENTPDSAPREMKDVLRKLKQAIVKLQKHRFSDVIIVTDHGFVMNTTSEAGDVCAKPGGNWIATHERAMLGQGDADGNNLVIEASKAGIAGDFNSFATPKAVVPYRTGLSYFHGGLSIQECVVPIISLKLTQQESSAGGKVDVKLSYKNGKTKINSRVFIIDIKADAEDLFAGDPFEVLIEARSGKEVVGETGLTDIINAATGTFKLIPGESARVTIKMLEDFEGKFTLVAVDPATDIVYDKVELKTDYMV